jgi:predicted ester cyclase
MATEATTQSPSGSTATKASLDIGELSTRLLVEPFNTGNLELIDEYVAPDAEFHDPSVPARLRNLRGPEVFKQVTSMYRQAFTDLEMVADQVVVQGDTVAIRWHSSGTHQGELEGFAPTGTRGTVTGMGFDRWKDGKIVEAWGEWDNLGLARQIGAAPPEGSFGEKIGMWMQHMAARRLRRKS